MLVRLRLVVRRPNSFAVRHLDDLSEVAVGDPGQGDIDPADGTDQRPGKNSAETERRQEAHHGECRDGDCQ